MSTVPEGRSADDDRADARPRGTEPRHDRPKGSAPRRLRRLGVLVVACVVAALCTSAAALAAPTPVPPGPAGGTPAPATAHVVRAKPHKRACPADPAPGAARCDAQVVTDAAGQPDATSGPAPGSYGPADLRSAYALPSSPAGAPTVAIVDAYDDPRAEADLGVYRAQYGLPACTTANGCFRKVNQNGGTNPPKADAGWAQEISLDLDMVSAACPGCRILLVETRSASFSDLGTGVNRAVALGARAVSNSYGGSEFSSETSADLQFFNHPGVAITASSGDSGYGAQYPAVSRYVTAVGGTSLTRTTSNARGWSETAWSGTGSGCSVYEAKPAWQTDKGCPTRAEADVAAVADPNTGVAVYDSYGAGTGGGWLVFGGTSAGAPIVAGVYALAGNTSAISNASFPYGHAAALNDVTSGSNGSCAQAYLCTAGAGYDGPTGLGTPRGTGAF